MIAIFLVGSILSSSIVNARKYQQLLTVEDGSFADEIQEVAIDSVPLLDKDSATILGNRKMGSMADMVSQFEVADDYTQINLNDVPVRVSPLKYAGFIKWFTNQSDGIPGYMQIDMTTQNTELVRLDQPIKYSKVNTSTGIFTGTCALNIPHIFLIILILRLMTRGRPGGSAR